MNRRELFKGLSAVLVAASIPLPVEQLIDLPDIEVISYLRRARLDLISQLINPPVILDEDGQMTIMKMPSREDALRHIDKLLKELGAA